ncbi:MAG: helix-turn-helix transcriptional regulator [Proteobacteria bacterium]|nr:helix-turn-helix transcriptional regulator [Pseudomonadota bacterium]
MRVAVQKSRPKTRLYAGVRGEERRAERRARLIEAAVRVYGEVGYRSATVKAVCAAAELTERYFYESFANSEALLIAAYTHVTATLHREMTIAGEAIGGGRDERIQRVLTLYFTRLQENPQPARVFLLEMHGISPAVDAVQMDAMKRMSGILLPRAVTEAVAAPMSLMEIGTMGAVVTIARRWVAQAYQQPVEDVIAIAAQFCRVAMPSVETNRSIARQKR